MKFSLNIEFHVFAKKYIDLLKQFDDPANLLDTHLNQLDELLVCNGQILQLLKLRESQHSFETVNPFQIQMLNKSYYLIIFISGPHYLLELNQ